MAKLPGFKADLLLKEVALEDAQKTLKFFQRSHDCSPDLIKEVEAIIKDLNKEIKFLKKEITRLENAKKKK